MKTSKSISTVSYNTPKYLCIKLQELQTAGIISFWAFILHQGEDDEAGLKDHLHLFIEPSKLIQTDNLKAEFKEPDLQKPDKPLGVISFRLSKFEHWYLYTLHDPAYLASKGQSRRFHYSTADFIVSDDDDFHFRIKSIDLLSLSPYQSMKDAIENGVSFEEYFSRGLIPVQQVMQYNKAWSLLSARCTNRNGRSNHNP